MGDCNDIDRLMNTLRIRVPGATDAALTLELFNTIDEHLRATNAWRYELTVPLFAGENTYPIGPPSGAALVRLLGAAHNNSPIYPVDTHLQPGDRGGAFLYSFNFPDYITFNVAPDAGAAQQPATFLLALTLDPCCQLDETDTWALEPWMFQRYFNDWLDGCLGRMMSQIAKPYSNPVVAQYHLRRFENAKGFGRQEASKGFVMNQPGWRFPRAGLV